MYPRLAALLVALVAIPARADHLVPDFMPANVFGRTTTGEYDLRDDYAVIRAGQAPSGSPAEVFLAPANLIPLHAVSANFLARLGERFPVADGWSFDLPNGTPIVAGQEFRGLSDGSLRVRTYDAQHPRPDPLSLNLAVGAQYHLHYEPGPGDPMSSIHWIQVVISNHKLGNDGGHGTRENDLDVPAMSTTPFYDERGTANASDFFDAPARFDDGNGHIWLAELWLVTGPAPGAGPGPIRFYGGTSWGWNNIVVPSPSSLALFACGGLGLLTIRRPAGGRAHRGADPTGPSR